MKPTPKQTKAVIRTIITTLLCSLFATSATAAELVDSRSPWEAPEVCSFPLGLPPPVRTPRGMLIPMELDREITSRLFLLELFPDACQAKMDGVYDILKARYEVKLNDVEVGEAERDFWGFKETVIAVGGGLVLGYVVGRLGSMGGGQ